MRYGTLLAVSLYMSTAWLGGLGGQFMGSYVSPSSDECNEVVQHAREAYGDDMLLTDCVEVSLGAEAPDYSNERQAP